MSLKSCNEQNSTLFQSGISKLLSIRKAFLEVLCLVGKSRYISSILAASKYHVSNVIKTNEGRLIAE